MSNLQKRTAQVFIQENWYWLRETDLEINCKTIQRQFGNTIRFQALAVSIAWNDLKQDLIDRFLR